MKVCTDSTRSNAFAREPGAKTTPHRRHNGSPVVVSSKLFDGLDCVEAGFALGALIGDFAPLENTLRSAQVVANGKTKNTC